MSQFSDRIRDLFLAAAEGYAPDQWAAFLDRNCGTDPDLRAAVERLLRARASLGPFHEPAPADGPAGRPGTVLAGRYKLVERIGEGGMGEVWMAQQTNPVKRLAAVKLIKPGLDSKHMLAQLETERQALALMDHPNIAKVFDAGTGPGGRPYFVMELVKGAPITQFCDQHHLTPRQRLELFVPVCQAVQHAHQKGVIHRDLKPSNVLVALYDDTPVPKVIDFGMAKAAGAQLTEATLHTSFGAVVGTVEYMSPEQATFNQLDVDTRSDVYSLGVLLYELLTGTTPLDRRRLTDTPLLELLRIVREDDTVRPSTRLSTVAELPAVAGARGVEPRKLSGLVRGELDWIVMKALEKDRARRYETANSFALDVQRYLADEPVLACPPSVGYRVRKFARRNKGGLAAAATVLVFLVLLGGGAGWAARDRAARQGRTGAQVDLILGEVEQWEREQKWPEALAAARRARAAAAGGEVDAATEARIRGRLVDLEFIDRLEQVRLEHAGMVERKSDYVATDRDYARAFRDYEADADELAVEASIDRLRARPALAVPLAAALDDWVHARRQVSGADAGRWQRLAAIARGIDPDPVRDRVRAAWGQPLTPAVRVELGRLAASIDVRAHHPATLVGLARTLQRGGNADAAIRLLRDARAVYPGDFWLNFDLGLALYGRRDVDGAVRFLTAAAAVRPSSPVAANNLGKALRSAGKLDEAVACLRTAVDLDPNNADYHVDLGYALGLGGQPGEAVVAYQEAVRLQPEDAHIRHAFGCFLRDIKQDYEGAVAAFKRAIELGPNNPVVYGDLGGALYRHGKLDEAIDAFREAVQRDPESAAYHAHLGLALARRGRVGEAADAFGEALRLEPTSAIVHHGFGCFLRDRKRDYAGALASFKRAAELDPNDAPIHESLAWLLATCPDPRLRDPGLAVAAAKKAVERGPSNPACHAALGVARYRAGDRKAAAAALEKAMALGNGGDGYDWLFLAMARWDLGEKDAARELYRRAVKWMDQHRPADEELRRFRAEAAELLGVTEKKPDG